MDCLSRLSFEGKIQEAVSALGGASTRYQELLIRAFAAACLPSLSVRYVAGEWFVAPLLGSQRPHSKITTVTPCDGKNRFLSVADILNEMYAIYLGQYTDVFHPDDINFVEHDPSTKMSDLVAYEALLQTLRDNHLQKITTPKNNNTSVNLKV